MSSSSSALGGRPVSARTRSTEPTISRCQSWRDDTFTVTRISPKPAARHPCAAAHACRRTSSPSARDQARFLRNGNELTGADLPELVVRPARERFRRHDLPSRQAHDRLVGDTQRAAGQRATEPLLQGDLPEDPLGSAPP